MACASPTRYSKPRPLSRSLSASQASPTREKKRLASGSRIGLVRRCPSDLSAGLGRTEWLPCGELEYRIDLLERRPPSVTRAQICVVTPLPDPADVPPCIIVLGTDHNVVHDVELLLRAVGYPTRCAFNPRDMQVHMHREPRVRALVVAHWMSEHERTQAFDVFKKFWPLSPVIDLDGPCTAIAKLGAAIGSPVHGGQTGALQATSPSRCASAAVEDLVAAGRWRPHSAPAHRAAPQLPSKDVKAHVRTALLQSGRASDTRFAW